MSNQMVNTHLQGANIFGAVAIAGLIAIGDPAVQTLALFSAALAYVSQMLVANAVATGSRLCHIAGWAAIIGAVFCWVSGVSRVLGV